MPTFTKLTPEEAQAWERWQQLQMAGARDEVRLVKCRARARLAHHIADKLTANPRQQTMRADMLHREAEAIALAQRLTGAIRFRRFRLMRTIKLWRRQA